MQPFNAEYPHFALFLNKKVDRWSWSCVICRCCCAGGKSCVLRMNESSGECTRGVHGDTRFCPLPLLARARPLLECRSRIPRLPMRCRSSSHCSAFAAARASHPPSLAPVHSAHMIHEDQLIAHSAEHTGSPGLTGSPHRTIRFNPSLSLAYHFMRV